MRPRLARLVRRVLAVARRVAAAFRRRATTIGLLWRQSLQFRVTMSTLALSSAVVFVLGMVLQNQITERLIDTKVRAAVAQTQAVVQTAEKELIGIDAEPEALRERLENALTKITSSSPAAQGAQSSAAGAFEPVLASGVPDRLADTVAAGDYWKVPPRLRQFVEAGEVSEQIHTISTDAGRTTYQIVGAPVTSTARQMQLYLLFPLTAEQTTVSTVQNTLMVGGFVLLLLLAGITNLVTRQVVNPVRRAASAAGGFADGDLDRRLAVIGEDDLAKLAVSYNEMAASIQRQIRQLEEFGQLQRRFTSDVSHELRTPLTTVRMAADVLHASREQFPAGLARSTELLVDELDRFEALLGDLLEISRLDAGVEELAAETMDLRPIAERAAEQVRVIAGTAGSGIELDLPDEEVTADVDFRRVERILRNLLANAVDHSEGRPVTLRLAMNETTIAVTVRDYGVGLRAGEAELVFNRFWRADPSRNRRTGGTGLGLAISHEDARLHGGILEAWGEPEQGACFRLTLPRTQDVPMGESPLDLSPFRPPAIEGRVADADPDEETQRTEAFLAEREEVW
ncbi:two-component sensor histidine kinase [Amycolatopsis antarctica]|uniref:Sensor histidine kinase MtrB n=1 Tax=Amycolatopsis antarctica TaxID=1854586 RepID=A0A263D818_9PSEU|nr:MtrAB system histidine kinase MtrB [Amycolatopsis antarctica]OZM73697.1 two-component sensor histidine kinase [Amycolatopsis antarctica]